MRGRVRAANRTAGAIAASFALFGAMGCIDSVDERPFAKSSPTVAELAAGPESRSLQAAEPLVCDDADPSVLSDFDGVLDGYGAWREDASYGRVWAPSAAIVGADFVPYASRGHWGLTDDGAWTWVSDDPWGFATFHFGRWVLLPQRQWAWVPGRCYAPAWVDWVASDEDVGYVGWAPLLPSWFWIDGRPTSRPTREPPTYTYCANGRVFERGLAAYLSPAPPSGERPPHLSAHPHRAPGRPPAIHIPPSGAPPERVRPDPRALAYMLGAARPVEHAAFADEPVYPPWRPHRQEVLTLSSGDEPVYETPSYAAEASPYEGPYPSAGSPFVGGAPFPSSYLLPVPAAGRQNHEGGSWTPRFDSMSPGRAGAPVGSVGPMHVEGGIVGHTGLAAPGGSFGGRGGGRGSGGRGGGRGGGGHGGSGRGGR